MEKTKNGFSAFLRHPAAVRCEGATGGGEDEERRRLLSGGWRRCGVGVSPEMEKTKKGGNFFPSDGGVAAGKVELGRVC